ncbi:unnamed protein product [Amoebophrya sp. A120]|nr:unnamed protein product [Amoebophrya sp. A120]|eukprot:GSA120T00025405001.1
MPELHQRSPEAKLELPIAAAAENLKPPAEQTARLGAQTTKAAAQSTTSSGTTATSNGVSKPIIATTGTTKLPTLFPLRTVTYRNKVELGIACRFVLSYLAVLLTVFQKLFYNERNNDIGTSTGRTKTNKRSKESFYSDLFSLLPASNMLTKTVLMRTHEPALYFIPLIERIFAVVFTKWTPRVAKEFIKQCGVTNLLLEDKIAGFLEKRLGKTQKYSNRAGGQKTSSANGTTSSISSAAKIQLTVFSFPFLFLDVIRSYTPKSDGPVDFAFQMIEMVYNAAVNFATKISPAVSTFLAEHIPFLVNEQSLRKFGKTSHEFKTFFRKAVARHVLAIDLEEVEELRKLYLESPELVVLKPSAEDREYAILQDRFFIKNRKSSSRGSTAESGSSGVVVGVAGLNEDAEQKYDGNNSSSLYNQAGVINDRNAANAIDEDDVLVADSVDEVLENLVTIKTLRKRLAQVEEKLGITTSNNSRSCDTSDDPLAGACSSSDQESVFSGTSSNMASPNRTEAVLSVASSSSPKPEVGPPSDANKPMKLDLKHVVTTAGSAFEQEVVLFAGSSCLQQEEAVDFQEDAEEQEQVKQEFSSRSLNSSNFDQTEQATTTTGSDLGE